MKFQCVSCGASRSDGYNKFAACDYCGGLPEVSLSYDKGLFDYAAKSKLKHRLESFTNEAPDLNAEVSLATLYLMDDLADLAKQRISRLEASEPMNPRVLLLSVLCQLKERGIAKTKIAVIDEIVGKLNLILNLDSDQFFQDVKLIADVIYESFYKKNGIKPSSKFKVIMANLEGAPSSRDSVLASILE